MPLSWYKPLIKVIMLQVWQYRTATLGQGSDGLFTSYINQFLKLKQEASGWPAWCSTEEDRATYIRRFHEREGVALDPAKISRNEGFRALAKLMLNSFWGKLAQRDNMPQTSIITTPEKLTEIITKPGVEAYVDVLNDDVMIATWKYEDDAVTPSNITSVVTAAYVTAIARLKLYSYLEHLGDRVLYFDTDSVIYVERPEGPRLHLGDFLGELTDEAPDKFKCAAAYIDVFVSGGPKNYAYSGTDGINPLGSVCVVKGINLHHTNSGTVNFDCLKRLVRDGATAPIALPPGSAIGRVKPYKVVTRPERKTYRVVYTKRRRVGDFNTLPFGYRH